MAFTKKWKYPADRSEYTGLYKSWVDMHKRAGNKNGKKPTYSDVTVCERWFSYDNFFEDMADTWFKGATLDKDSILPGNRVYCKEYCKWMTRSENSRERNQRLGASMLNPEIAKKHSLKMIGNKCRCKRIKCIENNEIFNSCIEAAKKYNINEKSISNAANPNDNNHKTAGGYHWEYIKEVIYG